MKRPFVAALVLLWGVSSLGALPWQGFTSLVLSPDGRWFATGGREGEVLWWETSTGELVHRWTLPGNLPVVRVAFDPQPDQLDAVLLDGTQAVLVPGEAASSPAVPFAPPQKPLVPADRWSAADPSRTEAGDLWAQGTPDGRISTGLRADGSVLASWGAHDAAVTGVALAPNGAFLVSCAYDGTLALWDPKTGRLLGRF